MVGIILRVSGPCKRDQISGNGYSHYGNCCRKAGILHLYSTPSWLAPRTPPTDTVSITDDATTNDITDPGATSGPSYLSAHSADVILSDIRPIKLKVEALHSINVLLDEFLYKIINTAQSLVTDKLRAGLLSVLPTPLGKEALLEAEVELRAYKDRTKSAKIVEDDQGTFNLAWAFEVRGQSFA